MADLPSPVTVNDLLVQAVIDRLDAILDRLPERASAGDPAAGEVELVEPSPPGRPAMKTTAAQPPRKRATKSTSREG